MRIGIFMIIGLSYEISGLEKKEIGTNKPGPCHVKNQDFQCDENGYYRMIQCNCQSCFCVAKHTGLVAYDTRTFDPSIKPKCGTCHSHLDKLFSKGPPPEGTYIPKCDVGLGDFELVQKDYSREDYYYCVDPKTGVKTKAPSTPNNTTGRVTCNGIEMFVDTYLVPTFETAHPQHLNFEPVGREYCLIDRDPGYECEQNTTSIRYWFDSETFYCYPFEHRGCGGNANSFGSSSECLSECVQADYFACARHSEPAKKSSGYWYSCPDGPQPPPGTPLTTTPGPALFGEGCPKGFTCLPGAFFGICCDESFTNRYEESHNVICSNKKEPYREQDYEYSRVILGKSCSDKFCPTNYTCENNEFFSFCCPV